MLTYSAQEVLSALRDMLRVQLETGRGKVQGPVSGRNLRTYRQASVLVSIQQGYSSFPAHVLSVTWDSETAGHLLPQGPLDYWFVVTPAFCIPTPSFFKTLATMNLF